ncbi:cytochrome P450 [Rhodocollybia butyracea]|nr:cytochrome P450 [Rhodocollybia butyracea]
MAIVAGSDTTASVLCNAIYYLLSNSNDLRRLIAEIEEFFPGTRNSTVTNIDTAKLADMTWLNAVINETLRLQPPVPSSIQRAPASGSGGKMMGPHFIKEGTSVVVSTYVIHRDPRYFSPNPDKFWPTRWLNDKRANNVTALETTAFIPFSLGQANCVGKRLAIFELQYVLVLLFSRYEISFAPEWDQGEWEMGLKDRLVLVKDRLMVEMKVRSYPG